MSSEMVFSKAGEDKRSQIDEGATSIEGLSAGDYEIKFDLAKVAYGTEADVPEVPTKQGLYFVGWYETTGEGAPGQAFDFSTKLVSDTELKALWSESPDSQVFDHALASDGETGFVTDLCFGAPVLSDPGSFFVVLYSPRRRHSSKRIS